MAYTPALELAELAHHCAGKGGAVAPNPAVAQGWSPEWNAITGNLEWRLRACHTPGSTCNVFVHGLLSAMHCSEPWVADPKRWPPKPNAIRLWRRDQEIRNPRVDDIETVSLLVYRAKQYNAHIAVALSVEPGTSRVLIAEGGQPGGKVRLRQFGSPDYAVPIDRLGFAGDAPTVADWRYGLGFPPVQYETAENFMNPAFLSGIDLDWAAYDAKQRALHIF